MCDDFEVMENKSVEIGLSATKRKTSIQIQWVFDLKNTKAENEVSFNAHMMAKGLTQEAGVDYFDG